MLSYLSWTLVSSTALAEHFHNSILDKILHPMAHHVHRWISAAGGLNVVGDVM
jgi:hypothetical protein